MYCHIFSFVEIPYRFLFLALESYFEALSFKYTKHVFQILFEPLAIVTKIS